MDQYAPAGKVGGGRYSEIGRPLAPVEFREARAIARDLGLSRLDVRESHSRLRRRLMVI